MALMDMVTFRGEGTQAVSAGIEIQKTPLGEIKSRNIAGDISASEVAGISPLYMVEETTFLRTHIWIYIDWVLGQY